jgi:hypothetical protein
VTSCLSKIPRVAGGDVVILARVSCCYKWSDIVAREQGLDLARRECPPGGQGLAFDRLQVSGPLVVLGRHQPEPPRLPQDLRVLVAESRPVEPLRVRAFPLVRTDAIRLRA